MTNPNHSEIRDVAIGQLWRHERVGDLVITEISPRGKATLLGHTPKLKVKVTADADVIAVSSEWTRIA